jgi:hypothetical protein
MPPGAPRALPQVLLRQSRATMVPVMVLALPHRLGARLLGGVLFQLGPIQLGPIQLGPIQLGPIQLGPIQLGLLLPPSILAPQPLRVQVPHPLIRIWEGIDHGPS